MPSARFVCSIVCCLVFASVAGIGVVGIVDAVGAGDATGSVDAAVAADASTTTPDRGGSVLMDQSGYVEDDGGVVTIRIEMESTSEGWFELKQENETMRVHLQDGNGDGRVEVQVNTQLDGMDAITGAGQYDTVSHLSGNVEFTPGEYTLSTGLPSSDAVSDVGNLRLKHPTVGRPLVWRLSNRDDSVLSTADEVRDSRHGSRIGNGKIPISAIEGDTVIFQFEATGLGGAYLQAEGTPVERFKAALDAKGGSIRFSRVRGDQREVHGSILDSPATQFVPHPQANEYYVLLDTARLADERPELVGPPDELGTQYQLRLAYPPVTTEDESVNRNASVSYTLDRPRAEFWTTEGTDAIRLLEGAQGNVRGNTNLASGTLLTVSLVGNETSNHTFPVSAGGGFELDVDAERDLERVEIYANGTKLAQQPVEYVDASGSLDMENQRGIGSAVLVSDVRTTYPSLVAVYVSEINRRPIGFAWVGANHSGDVVVPVGIDREVARNVTVAATLWADLDGNRRPSDGDAKLNDDGDPVRAEATVHIQPGAKNEQSDSTSTPTPERPTKTTGETIDDTGASAQPSTATSQTDSPGFDPLSSLVALLALTLVACVADLRRRR